MQIIILMVDYLNNGNSTNIAMLDYNEAQIHIVVTKIIMWIRAEYKRYLWLLQGKKNLHSPLVLDYAFDWCIDIKRLVENDSRFSQLFTVINNKMDLLCSNKKLVTKHIFRSDTHHMPALNPLA